VVCRPSYDRLARHMRPRLAALVVLVVVWVSLVVPGAWLGSLAIRQLPDAARDLRQSAARLHATQLAIPGVNPDSVVAHVGSRSAGWLSTALGPALAGIGHAVADLSIALLGLYFLLVTGTAAWNAVRRHLPFSADDSDELRRTFVDVTRATVLGNLSSAALQGLSIGLGLHLIGNGAPAFWGVVAGFTTLVPVVGNALVWVPAVVAPLVQRHFGAALLMLTFGKLVPSLLDRVVKVSIAKRVGNAHPMVTLVGALVGLRLIGPVGVLVGPAIVQCSFTLVQLYDREYGLPWTRAGTASSVRRDA
jgi:predicted PurR-regulated permease PerM